MKITKYGHCCLLIEEGEARILTDPGSYSENFQSLPNIHAIVITHEHGDHLHMGSLKEVLSNNPEAKVICNQAVARLMEPEGIAYELVEDGQTATVNGVKIAGFGTTHAEIYNKLFTPVQNTGYLFADHLFYPGDMLYNPQRPVPVLALPVAGPWLKMPEVIEYALELKPGKCFPVHDGILKNPFMMAPILQKSLRDQGIEFVAMENERPIEL